MATFSVKKTIALGIALAIPLAITGYVLVKVVRKFEKIVGPIAKKMGIDSVLGELTITVLAIILLIVITFLLGLIAQFKAVTNLKNSLESIILKVFPPLNHLKLMASERLHVDDAETNWKSVLVEKGGTFAPAFIIEETPEWITLVYTKFPTTDPGSLLITKADSIKYKPITMKEMRQFNRQFGKGYISQINK